MVCRKPEHKHTDSCYEQSNPEADVETEAVWRESVSGAKLTKAWGADLIEVASTQMGYKESTKNFIWDEEGNKKGYTRYGHWYGDTYGHWCAMFISFCMENAEIPEEVVPREASCRRWIQDLQKKELYETPDISTPVPGDLIFFDRNKDDISEHVGIVKDIVSDENGNAVKVRTIEGNTGANIVKEKEYKIDNPGIQGYGKVTKAQERYEKVLAANAGRAEFTFANADMSVTLSLSGLTELLPEDTALEVTKLTTENNPEFYKEALDAATKEIKDKTHVLSNINVFDMKLVSAGEVLDIQPQVNADVQAVFNAPLFEAEETQQAAELRTFALENPEEKNGGEAQKIAPAEVEGSYTGVQDGVTEVAYNTRGITPFAVTLANKTETGTFWRHVRNANELKNNGIYMVVSVEGNYAVTNIVYFGAAVDKTTPVTLEPVKGNPDYYKVYNVQNNIQNNIQDNIKFKYRYEKDWWENEHRYLKNSGVCLNPAHMPQLLEPLNNNVQLAFSTTPQQGCFSISNGSFHLNHNGTQFVGSQSTKLFSNDINHKHSRTADMIILEQVNTTLTIPDDAVANIGGVEVGTAQKPSYPAYVNVSKEKTGTYDAGDGITGTYASDPSTSQLESQFGNHPIHKNDFEAQKVDNGKALMDKSVIYKGDDYNAIGNYEDGTFGVTLSALGQVFDTNTTEVKTPMDVLFVLDMSRSMNDTFRHRC